MEVGELSMLPAETNLDVTSAANLAGRARVNMHTTQKSLRCPVSAVRPVSLKSRFRAARSSTHARPAAVKAQSKSDAMTLLLDCDGVLVDTEAEGHRVSFNEAFKQKGQCFHVITAGESAR